MKKKITIQNTTENMTPVIREILDTLDNDTETVIEFEKGEYHFHKYGSLHQMSYSACGASTENDTVFTIFDKKNVTIDGNGSDFVFCDRVQPFTLRNSENITLRNFTTDFSFMRYAYAEILSVSEEGMELYLDPELFQYSVKDGAILFHCGVEDMSTECRKISCKPICRTSGGIFFLYIGNYSGRYNPAAPNVLADAEKTENGVFLRYRENTSKPNFQVGGRICLAYDNDREMQAFHSEFSKNITLQNVTIHRQGGMGFVADVCDNIILDHFNIQLKPGREEYFTTTADGIFLTNCGGEFILRNSRITDTYDDAMNVHGYYTEIQDVLSENKVRIAHLHPSHWGLVQYLPGDTVFFSDPVTHDEVGSAEISEVSYDDDRRNIQLTFRDNTPLKKHLLIENRTRMAEVLIEDNEIKNCPHIRLSSRRMVVRRNKLSLSAGDIYVDDLIDFYKEYGAVESLLITENHFGNTGGHNIHILSQRVPTSNHLHENITIENNVFMRTKKAALSITAVQNLIERNNTFAEEASQ